MINKFLRTLVSNRVARYMLVNGWLAVVMTGVLACFVASGSKGEAGWKWQAMLTVVGVNALIFLWRTLWTLWALDRGMKITDKRDDYALERTTAFGWVVFLVLAFLGNLQGKPLYENVTNPPVGWILALVLWAPIVGVIGSSKGKLKARTPGGKTLAWPHMKVKNDSQEVRDNPSKREQVESSTSDDRQRRNKWNPQTLGNFSLVLIQGSLFSLFQIAASGASLEVWTMCLCFPILLLGFIIFFLARRRSPAGGVITGVGLLILTVFGIISSVGGASNAWIIAFQISILVVAWRASESLKGPNQKWIE